VDLLEICIELKNGALGKPSQQRGESAAAVDIRTTPAKVELDRAFPLHHVGGEMPGNHREFSIHSLV
jgi:hypothetical protein